MVLGQTGADVDDVGGLAHASLEIHKGDHLGAHAITSLSLILNDQKANGGHISFIDYCRILHSALNPKDCQSDGETLKLRRD
jgi:hypothetical protein